MSDPGAASAPGGRETAWLALGCALLCLVAAALGARSLDVPGLYYDEVIQAEPAVQFLATNGVPVDVPGMQTLRLFGGWFPVMTQTYMGALKSQALIPVFAAAGASAEVLRATTFGWGLLGLVFSLLWARELLGLRAALVAGALLAVDPSFLFISRHDWGSFALGLLCRSGGFYFLWAGAAQLVAAHPNSSGARWTATAQTLWRFALAGLLIGAGLYNKIDFAVMLGAVALAGALAAPRDLGRVLRAAARARFLPLVAAALGAALGAAPLLASLGRAFRAAGSLARGGGMGSADWSEKIHAFATTLDGSYFQRLMQTGGSFEEMFAVEGAASGVFIWLLTASAVLLVAKLVFGETEAPNRRLCFFLLAATLLGGVGIFFTPRAVRIHHILNLYPFPQLLVSAALLELWQTAASRRTWRIALRVLAGAALCVSVSASARVDIETLAMLRHTGGKGRWSDTLERFGRELAEEPGARVVSLDWGFWGPLRFAARDLPSEEPFWKLWRPGKARRLWTHDGSRHDVYLLQESRLAVFDYGSAFLEAVSALPPEAVGIRRHNDREGDPAFVSVRILQPHRIRYQNRFEILMR